MSYNVDPPIIVTARLDAVAQGRFDALRTQYFPPGRTVLDAHLTLFHALPPDTIGGLWEQLARLVYETPPFSAAVSGVCSLGRGAAARIASPQLVALRQKIAASLRGRLTPQDAQPFKPHITLANKLTAAETKPTLEALRAERIPCEITITGVILWRYLGPQWRLEREFLCIGR